MATPDELRAALIAAHQAGDDESARTLAEAIKAQEPDNSLAQWAGVATHALGPTAVAAGGGAAATGIPSLGMAAPEGAALGALSLNAGDLGYGVLNAGRQAFGKTPISTPSESIQSGLESHGIGRTPQTTAQRIFHAILQGGSSGYGGALGMASLAGGANSGVWKNIATAMAENPGLQAKSGAFAGAGGQGAAEAGGGPIAQSLAAIMAGTVPGGMKFRPGGYRPTKAELTDAANAKYAAAKTLTFDPTDMRTKLGDSLQNTLSNPADPQFNFRLHPEVSTALEDFQDMLKSANGQPIPFSRLEQTRKLLTKASISDTPDEQRVAGLALKQLDDYVNSTVPKEARQLWAQRAKLNTIQLIRDKADAAPGDPAAAIKSQFRNLYNKLAKNPQGFNPDEVAAIRKVATGGKMENLLQTFGMLAPGGSPRGTAAIAGLGGIGYGTGSVLIPAGIGASAMLSRALAKRLAKGASDSVEDIIARGESVPVEKLLPFIPPNSPKNKIVRAFMQRGIPLSQEALRTRRTK